jgi:hypothetical protein
MAAVPATAKPSSGVALLAVACAAIGIGVSYGIWSAFSSPVLKISSDFSAFAGLFVLAAAIERLLEPFSSMFFDVEDAEVTAATSAAAAEADKTNAGLAATAATDAAHVDKLKSQRGFMMWAFATILAAVACAIAGGFLLAAIVSPGSLPPKWIDLALTALIVGAGTKPLHDLIGYLAR